MIRAGILVTGTEVLTGAVNDRNGPWLSQRLQEAGVEVAEICIVGDRPADMRFALEHMRDQGLSLIVTSGGLGPTADDRTVEEVARWLGLPLALDEGLEHRIEEIIRPLRGRLGVSAEAFAAGNRKQATVPEGSTILEPVGTAPGLVIPSKDPRTSPTLVVLPGPPRELQPMWHAALRTQVLSDALNGVTGAEIRTIRMFGVPESQLAQTLREAEEADVPLGQLEVTTCQHRGELEITTRVHPGSEAAYEALARFLASRHGEELFSTDSRTVDELVAEMLRGRYTIATAESCTGGMLAARLTDLPGSSEYVRGGVVAYGNEVKVESVGVSAELLMRHGAVSAEVASALAQGARTRMHADVAVGITGVAGPGGGSEEKPVGLVWIAVAGPGDSGTVRSVRLPGGRGEVRERAVTVAMHLVRRALPAAGIRPA